MSSVKNELANEKSPYLLQHAENPVNWYPWSQNAFRKAKKENKPVFLSIGYSTCHWCHVMAHESFEDKEVAEILNKNFISIKVDREERPDIDKIYMNVCQRLTGSGGWPLTIIITPEKKPFYAATYLPKDNLIKLCENIADLWYRDKEKLLNSANRITDLLKNNFETKNELSYENISDKAFEIQKNSFDERYGGFGAAPKFPTPHKLLFLLRYWNKTGNDKALEMVEKTLVEIRKGGICDQLGYGFHRYSTDNRWHIPHFEKMLYDQALLLYVYTEAYEVTNNPLFKKTVSEIVDYIKREMTSADNGFYSAEDADSEGEEGKFYTWDLEEIKEILNDKELKLFLNNYSFTDSVENSTSFNKDKKDSKNLYIEDIEFLLIEDKNMSSIRKKLFEYRDKRVHPAKDDKILTDWNGLMIAALTRAATIDKKYLELAERAVKFILENLYDKKENILYHRYRDGDRAIKANLDDYSFLIWGLIELFEVTFKANYLEKAINFSDYILKNFWDKENGGFYFTEEGIEKPFMRQKEYYDGAIPSGNSIAAWNLKRLSHLTANKELEEKSREILQSFALKIERQPGAYSQSLVALQALNDIYYDIIIVGQDKEEIDKFFKMIKSEYIPNKSIVVLDEENKNDLIDVSMHYKNYSEKNDSITFYVCKNYTCSLPTNEITKLMELLDLS